MKNRYWQYKRNNYYYLQDRVTGKRESLHTSDKAEASKLRDAKNSAVQQPVLNLALAKTYLLASDPEFSQRTWQMVFASYIGDQNHEATRERMNRAFVSEPFNRIRNHKVVETGIHELRNVARKLKSYNNHIFHRAHNYAHDLVWLLRPVPKKHWPKPVVDEGKIKEPKRGITLEEHNKIIASEQNAERRLFYQMLWEIGSSQSDAAHLTAQNLNWTTRLLTYHRAKTGRGPI